MMLMALAALALLCVAAWAQVPAGQPLNQAIAGAWTCQMPGYTGAVQQSDYMSGTGGEIQYTFGWIPANGWTFNADGTCHDTLAPNQTHNYEMVGNNVIINVITYKSGYNVATRGPFQLFGLSVTGNELFYYQADPSNGGDYIMLPPPTGTKYKVTREGQRLIRCQRAQ